MNRERCEIMPLRDQRMAGISGNGAGTQSLFAHARSTLDYCDQTQEALVSGILLVLNTSVIRLCIIKW